MLFYLLAFFVLSVDPTSYMVFWISAGCSIQTGSCVSVDLDGDIGGWLSD